MTVDKVELKKFVSPFAVWLVELSQTVSVKFSFVAESNGVFTQLITPSKCRDFLGDMLWSRNKKQAATIYGMTYDYAQTPYDTDALKLSLTFPDEGAKNYFLTNANSLLRSKEEQAQVTSTKVLETQEKDTLIVIADKIWMNSVWRLSLYTYYLKICCYKDPKELGDPEVGYEKVLNKENIPGVRNEDVLLKEVSKKVRLKPPKRFGENIRDNHNFRGFVSLLQNHDSRYGGRNVDYLDIFTGELV